jgi:hypothetical protein
MPNISLKAHYDGHTIQLDEPYELPRDAQLLVTVLSPLSHDPDLIGWTTKSADGLVNAYGDTEPDYSEADLLP